VIVVFVVALTHKQKTFEALLPPTYTPRLHCVKLYVCSMHVVIEHWACDAFMFQLLSQI